MSTSKNYLESILFEFQRYKTLGDKTFEQLNNEELLWTYSKSDNSIAIITKHIAGNMLSRWTNFLEEDGEKSWRNRETEFQKPYTTKKELLSAWEKGWECLFKAIESIDDNNFNTLVKIRNEDHTIIEAINRQLAHYSSHIGQIVVLGKMIKGEDWISLSIPKGDSEAFNKVKFNQ